VCGPGLISKDEQHEGLAVWLDSGMRIVPASCFRP
jgi:hypothetical protein